MRFLLVLLTMAALLAGCGGGGGGGTSGPTVLVTGTVVDVASGGALATAPTVQIGTATVKADATDGSFSINAPKGSTKVLVTSSLYGTFSFTVAALNADTDLGSLWVGPSKVTVKGVVRDAESNAAVANATVTFGGRTGTTNASGVFSLADVAYTETGAFGSILGSVSATGYIENEFSANGLSPTAGVIDVGDLLILSTGGGTPPDGPYNIWGKVSPTASAPGTTVVLSQGGTDVRQTTVGSDGRYFFWVTAGTYTLTFTNGTLSATTNVTLGSTNQVIRKDVTLS